MPVEVIERADDLPAIATEWNGLADRFDDPLLRFEWFNACARASSPAGTLCIVLIRSDGEISAIAPLVLVKRGTVATLHFLGDALCALGEPSGFLYKDEQSLQALVDAVIAQGKPLRLDRIRADTPAAIFLAKTRRGVAAAAPRNSSSLFVPVETSWDRFEAGISKSGRTNLRRKRKAAEKFGDVEFEISSPTSDNIQTYLDNFVAVEASGWKERQGTSIKSTNHQQRFWIHYTDAIAGQNVLRVFSMRIGGEVAAERLTVEHAGRLWELKIAYNEKFRRCSPGVLLTHETLRYVFDRGLKAYEFLGYEENWERTWAAENVHGYLSFRMYPLSVGGSLGLVLDTSRYVYNRGVAYLNDHRQARIG